jgi:hypothetical protein
MLVIVCLNKRGGVPDYFLTFKNGKMLKLNEMLFCSLVSIVFFDFKAENLKKRTYKTMMKRKKGQTNKQ